MGTEVQRFYSNANVFITGGTGFLGKIIIQKLLRSCSDISGVYLLVRRKKEQDPIERFTEIFSDAVFDELKRVEPEFKAKIHLVEGDCSQPGLGITKENRELLYDRINVVFHCAASMNMDAKIKDAVGTNIQGLTELLDLCMSMQHLKSMIYVSTAYSNCTQYLIEEKFYNPPIQAATLTNLTQELNESVLNDITPGLLDKWPNTYCYTKAVAESVLREKAKELPLGLFRPTIVMSTYYDPIPGWTSNIYGPVGVMLGTGLGVLRVFYCDSNKHVDLVPVDFCTNALICAAWEVHQKWKIQNNQPNPEIPVYNYSGGPDRNVTWNYFKKIAENYQYPLKNILWVTVLTLTTNKLWFRILWIFLHIIPGYLTDLYLRIIRKSPRVMKAYEKIAKFNKVLTNFSTNEWDIQNKNVYSLWDQLEDEDKKLFPFNMDFVNHKQFISNTCIGIKLYIMKENLDNADAEKQHYQRLMKFHNTIKYTFYLAVIGIFFKFISLLS